MSEKHVCVLSTPIVSTETQIRRVIPPEAIAAYAPDKFGLDVLGKLLYTITTEEKKLINTPNYH